MFIIVLCILFHSSPLFNVQRCLLSFFGIPFHFPVLFKIVNSSSAVLYPSLPPALSTVLFPLFSSQRFCSSKPLHKFLFELNMGIQAANHFNWVTIKIGKAHFWKYFFWPWSKFWCRLSTEYGFYLALWHVMYLLDPPQDPPVSAH